MSITEEDLLGSMFGDSKVWYCDFCESFITICKHCKNSSCSGAGCSYCANNEFLKDKKSSVRQYLSPEENLIFDKIISLKKIMRISLNRGDSKIDWQKEYTDGHFSKNETEIYFVKELKGIK